MLATARLAGTSWQVGHNLELTPEEREAIQIVWKAEQGLTETGVDPPPEEAARILAAIRQREASAEAYALGELRRATRLPDTISGFGSPYYRLVLTWVLIPIVIIALLFELIAALFHL